MQVREFTLAHFLLTHLPYHLNNLSTNLLRFFLRMRFGINANNRLGVRFAKMHPLVGKINFYAVDIRYFQVAVWSLSGD